MSIKQTMRRLILKHLKWFVLEILNTQIRVWGDPSKLTIAPTAQMCNTLFNTSSGRIAVGDYSFAGHNASVITGTHDYNKLMKERQLDFPSEGRDIIIGRGVWLGTNALILGPCKVGDHSVIAAGSVVLPGTDIPAFTLVAGVPARIIRSIAPGAIISPPPQS
jgi:acetyltransferase-like isoleucine patch superfamily enzyme